MPPDDDAEALPEGVPLPFDGPVLIRAGSLASIPPNRLPEILRRVQRDLGFRVDDYRRRYERVEVGAERELFLVEPDHWETVAERLGLIDRERDAVARAHERQAVRLGDDRREELETALEIRTAVVLAVADAADAEST